MGKQVLRAVLWGILIAVLGAFTAANVGVISGGTFGENAIFTLLLYLLLVVSIFGVLILTKLSDLERGRRKQDKSAEEGGNAIEKR